MLHGREEFDYGILHKLSKSPLDIVASLLCTFVTTLSMHSIKSPCGGEGVKEANSREPCKLPSSRDGGKKEKIKTLFPGCLVHSHQPERQAGICTKDAFE